VVSSLEPQSLLRKSFPGSLVVDTGIHAKHWTREQAISYMLERAGMGEKDVTAEVERYIVDPGHACAYKVGMLKIQELRERAQRELGNKLDQREFHDAILKNGALPLEILEEQVNAYIRSKQAPITAQHKLTRGADRLAEDIAGRLCHAPVFWLRRLA
jgi:hypothetical protein